LGRLERRLGRLEWWLGRLEWWLGRLEWRGSTSKYNQRRNSNYGLD
jgi:hypothetical protein